MELLDLNESLLRRASFYKLSFDLEKGMVEQENLN
jgi:hypothetical protein